MGYTKTFLSGFGWSTFLKLASKGLAFVKIIILARLLSQHDYGLFSLTIVVVSLFEVFAETGINTILVQTKENIEEYINSAWVLSIFRGILIACIVVIASFVMRYIYKEQELLFLVLLAAFVPFIRGFINPSIILPYKKLYFSKDSVYRFSLVCIEVLFAIIFGVLLQNAYALVFSLIIASLFEVVISFVFFSPRPKFVLQTSVIQNIFSHAKWLNGVSILNYLNRNLDDLIIGKMLNTQLLGLYDRTYQLSHSPTADMGSSVYHASFPVYNKFLEDPTRLKKAFFKIIVLFAGLQMIPLFLFLFFPKLLTLVILGNEWIQAASFLPLLALAGYFQGLLNVGYSLLVARRLYKQLILILIIPLGVMVISLFFFIQRFGLIGAGFATMFSRVVVMPYFGYIIRKHIATKK